MHTQNENTAHTTWFLFMSVTSFAFEAIQQLHSIKNVLQPLLDWKIVLSHYACLDCEKN